MRTTGGPVPWIEIDPTESEPIYRQIYTSIREGVLSGRLPVGSRLPSTRALAQDLGVSRSTVVQAFERLWAEGYLESRVGSGTRVAASVARERHPGSATLPRDHPASPAAPLLSGAAERLMEVVAAAAARDEVRPFRPGLPAIDAFPFTQWRQASIAAIRRVPLDLLQVPEPAGVREFREHIAAYVSTSRGVRCAAEQVVVTTGTQQAVARLASMLLSPGDAAWIEDPGYLGARRALLLGGADLVPVGVDEAGLDVDQGIERAGNARLVYVSPSHQFPTGATLSLERRFRLLEWAASTGAWILEDDYDGEYRFEGRALRSLQGLDRSGRVVYLGTLNKMLFPGLRLGYVVLPPGLVEPFVAFREVDDGPPPVLDQLAAAEFFDRGLFARHLRRMRTLYRERRDALVQALRSGCRAPLEFGPVPAGMHLVLWLPAGVSDLAVSRQAEERGLTAFPVSLFSLRPPPRGGLVLGFAAWDPPRLRDAAALLADVVNHHLRPS